MVVTKGVVLVVLLVWLGADQMVVTSVAWMVVKMEIMTRHPKNT
jgi:hypothetical protein